MSTNADRAAQCASEAQNATDNARSIDVAANRAMLNSFAAPAEDPPSPPPWAEDPPSQAPRMGLAGRAKSACQMISARPQLVSDCERYPSQSYDF